MQTILGILAMFVWLGIVAAFALALVLWDKRTARRARARLDAWMRLAPTVPRRAR